MDSQFVTHCHDWAVHTFGMEVTRDVQERCRRFLEEACELTQALGLSEDDAIKLVRYVYGRAVGVPTQELGGVAVTLALLANAANLRSPALAGQYELERCWRNSDAIRAKHQSKKQAGVA